MLLIPHLFSNLALCITGVLIFLKYYKLQPDYSRLLWGFFFLSASLTALTEVISLTSIPIPDKTTELALILERTLGAVAVVSATWCIVMHVKPGHLFFFATIAVGAALFYCTIFYEIPILSLIILPFCIIITLLICCLGLASKQKSALWIIFAMMFVALSVKSRDIPLPMSPVDINRCLMILALFCTGKALRNEYKILF